MSDDTKIAVTSDTYFLLQRLGEWREAAEKARKSADMYELQWRRAMDGAATANKGVRRLKAKVESLRAALNEAKLDTRYEGGRCARLEHENTELKKKIERLSLHIIKLWGEGCVPQ